MFRYISVKKLFIVLLAAIVVMLFLFFAHGPFLEEEQERAITEALLGMDETAGEDMIAAEGHRLFQITVKEGRMEAWGLFSRGTFKKNGDGTEAVNIKEAAPAKMVFAEKNGEWELEEYLEPEDTSFSGEEMKKVFPFHLRVCTLMSDWFKGDLEKQMQAYTAK